MTEMGHNWPSLSLGSRRVPKPGTATPVPELNLLQDAERGIDLDARRYGSQNASGLLDHSSRHNHQYRSNSFGEPRDHRTPCGERYGHGTRYRHRREVVYCPALRL